MKLFENVKLCFCFFENVCKNETHLFCALNTRRMACTRADAASASALSMRAAEKALDRSGETLAARMAALHAAKTASGAASSAEDAVGAAGEDASRGDTRQAARGAGPAWFGNAGHCWVPGGRKREDVDAVIADGFPCRPGDGAGGGVLSIFVGSKFG